MNQYEFDIIVTGSATETDANYLFELFDGDISVTATEGKGTSPQYTTLSVCLVAHSMDEAVQDAVQRVAIWGRPVLKLEWTPIGIGLEPTETA